MMTCQNMRSHIIHALRIIKMSRLSFAPRIGDHEDFQQLIDDRGEVFIVKQLALDDTPQANEEPVFISFNMTGFLYQYKSTEKEPQGYGKFSSTGMYILTRRRDIDNDAILIRRKDGLRGEIDGIELLTEGFSRIKLKRKN